MNNEIEITANTVVTHGGAFHADDIFACAMLKAWHAGEEIVRTRDKSLIEKAKEAGAYIVDVGGEFEPSRRRFDHHFVGSPVRENGIPFASAGMVAEELCPAAPDWFWEIIQSVDAKDTGSPVPVDWTLSMTIHKCNPLLSRDFDDRFTLLVHIVKSVLRKIIKLTKEEFLFKIEAHPQVREWVAEYEGQMSASTERVQAAFQTEGPVILLDRYECSLMENAHLAPPCKLYSVYPGPNPDEWLLQQIPTAPMSMEGRKPLPEAWKGLRDQHLDSATGIEGCIFIHPNRFIGGHRTREGAVQVAHLAASL
jgi:uncharacterized UPF0160 family protein